MASATLPTDVRPAACRVADDLVLEVGPAVLAELRQYRARLHAARRERCDASFGFAPRFLAQGWCPCVGDVVDALTEVCRYLVARREQVASRVAVARVHCRTRVVRDLGRARRGERTQQRVDRLDTGSIGAALATSAQRDLLRDLVLEAGSDAPLAGQAQLERRLARLRADRLGGAEADHLPGVRADLPVVRAAAASHGRRHRNAMGELVSWWEFFVETGLGRRHRLGDLSVGEPADDRDERFTTTVDVADPAAERPHEWLLAVDALRRVTGEPVTGDPDHALARTIAAAGAAPARQAAGAVRSLLLALADAGVLPEAVVSAVVTDPRRLRAVVRCARTVTAGR